MNGVLSRARVAAVLACVLWALASVATVADTSARVEYAQAAAEARAVVRLLAERPDRSPSPIRRIVAQGSLARVRGELVRFLGHEPRGLETNDRVQVYRSWFTRVVSVPVKDRDQWDIVGAVALQAEPWSGLAIPVLAIALAAVLAAVLALRGLERLATNRAASVYAAMIAPVATLSLVMAVVSVTLRQRIDAAAATLPRVTSLTRFDSLSLPLPSPALGGIALALILVAASALLFVIGWASSAARRATERRETLTAWSFLAPSALHLLLFTLGPLVFTLYLSFHDWDLLRVDRPFVGIGNYVELAQDPLFWRSLANTALYSLYVPVSMALALGAALILNQPLRGMKALRAIVFLPTVVSYVAIAIVWQWMFNVDFGLLNYIGRSLHLAGIDWLGDPRTALIAVMIVSAWVQLGYQMVIYLAGLQGIPSHLLEAATLDGAGRWQRFRHITLPLLRPVTVYLLVTGIIWSFQVFTLVYVMTEGGPVHATDVVVYRIYQNAWEFRRMGYASAMSWVLFAILLGLTLLQWRALNRTVDHAT